MNNGELTAPEQASLQRLEGEYQQVQESFVRGVAILLEIKDARLYRAEYATFEQYCRQRWDLSRQRVYQLLDASEVIADLSTTVDTTGGTSLPTNERQTREVKRVPKEKRAEVWEKVVKTAPKDQAGEPQVTASHVRRVVDAEKPTPASSPESPHPEPWQNYNEQIDRLIDLYSEAKSIFFALAEWTGKPAAFTNWIDRKQYEKFFKDTIPVLEGQKVARWATTAEQRAISQGRIFLFAYELPTADKRAKKGKGAA